MDHSSTDPSCPNLSDWLTNNGLSAYAASFAAEGFEELEDVFEFIKADIAEGQGAEFKRLVPQLGHRTKMQRLLTAKFKPTSAELSNSSVALPNTSATSSVAPTPSNLNTSVAMPSSPIFVAPNSGAPLMRSDTADPLPSAVINDGLLVGVGDGASAAGSAGSANFVVGDNASSVPIPTRNNSKGLQSVATISNIAAGLSTNAASSNVPDSEALLVDSQQPTPVSLGQEREKCSTPIVRLTEATRWLKENRLDRWAHALQEEGYDEVDDLASLALKPSNAARFEKLVTLSGHREKMVRLLTPLTNSVQTPSSYLMPMGTPSAESGAVFPSTLQNVAHTNNMQLASVGAAGGTLGRSNPVPDTLSLYSSPPIVHGSGANTTSAAGAAREWVSSLPHPSSAALGDALRGPGGSEVLYAPSSNRTSPTSAVAIRSVQAATNSPFVREPPTMPFRTDNSQRATSPASTISVSYVSAGANRQFVFGASPQPTPTAASAPTATGDANLKFVDPAIMECTPSTSAASPAPSNGNIMDFFGKSTKRNTSGIITATENSVQSSFETSTHNNNNKANTVSGEVRRTITVKDRTFDSFLFATTRGLQDALSGTNSNPAICEDRQCNRDYVSYIVRNAKTLFGANNLGYVHEVPCVRGCPKLHFCFLKVLFEGRTLYWSARWLKEVTLGVRDIFNDKKSRETICIDGSRCEYGKECRMIHMAVPLNGREVLLGDLSYSVALESLMREQWIDNVTVTNPATLALTTRAAPTNFDLIENEGDADDVLYGQFGNTNNRTKRATEGGRDGKGNSQGNNAAASRHLPAFQYNSRQATAASCDNFMNFSFCPHGPRCYHLHLSYEGTPRKFAAIMSKKGPEIRTHLDGCYHLTDDKFILPRDALNGVTPNLGDKLSAARRLTIGEVCDVVLGSRCGGCRQQLLRVLQEVCSRRPMNVAGIIARRQASCLERLYRRKELGNASYNAIASGKGNMGDSNRGRHIDVPANTDAELEDMIWNANDYLEKEGLKPLSGVIAEDSPLLLTAEAYVDSVLNAPPITPRSIHNGPYSAELYPDIPVFWDLENILLCSKRDLTIFIDCLTTMLVVDGVALDRSKIKIKAFATGSIFHNIADFLRDSQVEMCLASDKKAEEVDRMIEKAIREQVLSPARGSLTPAFVLISSDKDYLSLVDEARALGKQVFIIHDAESNSDHQKQLVNHANKCFSLAEVYLAPFTRSSPNVKVILPQSGNGKPNLTGGNGSSPFRTPTDSQNAIESDHHYHHQRAKGDEHNDRHYQHQTTISQHSSTEPSVTSFFAKAAAQKKVGTSSSLPSTTSPQQRETKTSPSTQDESAASKTKNGQERHVHGKGYNAPQSATSHLAFPSPAAGNESVHARSPRESSQHKGKSPNQSLQLSQKSTSRSATSTPNPQHQTSSASGANNNDSAQQDNVNVSSFFSKFGKTTPTPSSASEHTGSKDQPKPKDHQVVGPSKKKGSKEDESAIPTEIAGDRSAANNKKTQENISSKLTEKTPITNTSNTSNSVMRFFGVGSSTPVSSAKPASMNSEAPAKSPVTSLASLEALVAQISKKSGVSPTPSVVGKKAAARRQSSSSSSGEDSNPVFATAGSSELISEGKVSAISSHKLVQKNAPTAQNLLAKVHDKTKIPLVLKLLRSCLIAILNKDNSIIRKSFLIKTQVTGFIISVESNSTKLVEVRDNSSANSTISPPLPYNYAYYQLLVDSLKLRMRDCAELYAAKGGDLSTVSESLIATQVEASAVPASVLTNGALRGHFVSTSKNAEMLTRLASKEFCRFIRCAAAIPNFLPDWMLDDLHLSKHGVNGFELLFMAIVSQVDQSSTQEKSDPDSATIEAILRSFKAEVDRYLFASTPQKARRTSSNIELSSSPGAHNVQFDEKAFAETFIHNKCVQDLVTSQQSDPTPEQLQARYPTIGRGELSAGGSYELVVMSSGPQTQLSAADSLLFLSAEHRTGELKYPHLQGKRSEGNPTQAAHNALDVLRCISDYCEGVLSSYSDTDPDDVTPVALIPM